MCRNIVSEIFAKMHQSFAEQEILTINYFQNFKDKTKTYKLISLRRKCIKQITREKGSRKISPSCSAIVGLQSSTGKECFMNVIHSHQKKDLQKGQHSQLMLIHGMNTRTKWQLAGSLSGKLFQIPNKTVQSRENLEKETLKYKHASHLYGRIWDPS